MTAVHLFDSSNIDQRTMHSDNYNTAITLFVIGLLVIIAGVFLALAAYRILPVYSNIISQIGTGAWSLGTFSTLIGIGIVGLSIVLFKTAMASKDSCWLDVNFEGYFYMQFLATQFSEIYVPELEAIGKLDSAIPHPIDQIENYLFELLPRDELYDKQKNIPIALSVSGTHSTLIYIDRSKRTVEYYDSKKNYGEYDKIITTLTQIAARLSQEEPLLSPYQFIPKIQKVLQPDGYQCVVWLLYFLENRLKRPEIDFNTLDVCAVQPIIQHFRKHIQTAVRNDIPELYSKAIAKERTAYLTVYGDRKIAAQKHAEDHEKLGAREWRKLALSGKSLKPEKLVESIDLLRNR